MKNLKVHQPLVCPAIPSRLSRINRSFPILALIAVFAGCLLSGNAAHAQTPVLRFSFEDSRLNQADSLPAFGINNPQWNIGYQYLGGITTWHNPVYTGPSWSPVKLSNAKPHWCLAADAIVRTDLGWGVDPPRVNNNNGEYPLYESVPPHRNGGSVFPPWGNQVFCDGSAQWIKIQDMRFLTSFLKDGSRNMYFHQDSKDFTGVLAAKVDLGGLSPSP